MLAFKSFGRVVAIRVNKVLFVHHREDEGVCEAKHHKEIRELCSDCEILVVPFVIIKGMFDKQKKPVKGITTDWNRVRLMDLYWRVIN